MGIGRQEYVLVDAVVRLQAAAVKNGAVFSAGFTALVAGLHDALLVDCTAGRFTFDSPSTGVIVHYVRHFLTHPEAVREMAPDAPPAEAAPVPAEAAGPEGAGFCEECGEPLEADAAFCGECGATVD